MLGFEEETKTGSVLADRPQPALPRHGEAARDGAAATATDQDQATIWRLPAVGGLTLFRARYRLHRFTRHRHPTYVLAASAGGSHRIWLRGKLREVGPGSLVFIEPGEIHTGEGAELGLWTYRAAYLHPRLWQETLSFLGVPSMIRVRFPRCVVDDEALSEEFLEIHRRLELPEPSPGHATLVSNLLLRIVATHGRIEVLPPPAAEVRPELQRVRRRLETPSRRTVTLDQLSDLSGMSRFHLVRSFQRAFGLPPRAYGIQVRIEASLPLLVAGQPVGRVARAVGFRSGSYFARAFRERVGLTPRQYAAGMNGGG